MLRSILIIFLCVLGGCTRSPQIVSVNYVRSSDIKIPELDELYHRASTGDLDAQYKLGVLQYNGLGIPMNHKKAMSYWQSAAESGHLEAQYALGMAYFMGKGITNDFVKGCHWLRQASTHGHTQATYEYHIKCTP